MELKTINIDGEDVEIAIKLDPEYFEENKNLENTLELKLDEIRDGDKNDTSTE